MVDPSSVSQQANSSGKRPRAPPLVNEGKVEGEKKQRVSTTHSSGEASREGKTPATPAPPHVDEAHLLINPEDSEFVGYRHTEEKAFNAKLIPEIAIPGQPERKGQLVSVKLPGVVIFAVKIGKDKKSHRETSGCASIGVELKTNSVELLKNLESNAVPIANANEFCQKSRKPAIEYKSNTFFTTDKKTGELTNSVWLGHKGENAQGGAPYDIQDVDFAKCQDGKTHDIKFSEAKKLLEKGKIHADVYLSYVHVWPNMKMGILYHKMVISRIVLYPDVEVKSFNPMGALLKTKRGYGKY